MYKDINNMKIREIFNKIGRIIAPQNIYYIMKDDETEIEFDKIYKEIIENPQDGIDKMQQFLEEHEDSIDKELLVLITLQNYLEYRNRRDEYETKNQYIYEIKIEECKRMLDNKDVATYGFLDDPKTGKVKDIVEISSVDLCSETVFTKNQMYPDQDKMNKKRQERYNTRKEKNKKNIERKQRRLKEIENDFNLKNILQFVDLTDLEDIIIANKNVAAIIKNMILRNGVIEGLKLDKIEINKLLENGEFYDLIEKVDPIVYVEEFEKALKDNIQFFDLDKMLICAAYRALEKATIDELDEEDLASIKLILQVIYQKTDDGKGKIERKRSRI